MPAFDVRRYEAPESLHDVYGVDVISCDTHMRTTPDEVFPYIFGILSATSYTRCNGAKYGPE